MAPLSMQLPLRDMLWAISSLLRRRVHLSCWYCQTISECSDLYSRFGHACQRGKSSRMQRDDDERTADMADPAAKYTDEFGHETADHAISTGRPFLGRRRELGLDSKTVNRWAIKRWRGFPASPTRRSRTASRAGCAGAYAGSRRGTRSQKEPRPSPPAGAAARYRPMPVEKAEFP